MTSPKRIEANRRNAAMSTGPRTEAGKAAAALNALRHGLLTREILVKGESEEDFTAFARGVRGRFAPVGELETFVVNRVISASWRLRRASAADAALFNAGGSEAGAEQDRLGKMLLLSRYEVALERSLYKALDEFHGLRHKRHLFADWYPENEDNPEAAIAASAPDEPEELGSFRKNDPPRMRMVDAHGLCA